MAKNLNEKNFDKFGNIDEIEKRNTNYIAMNISLNGNTNSVFFEKLKGNSNLEKEKIFEREAALRIIFSLR